MKYYNLKEVASITGFSVRTIQRKFAKLSQSEKDKNVKYVALTSGNRMIQYSEWFVDSIKPTQNDRTTKDDVLNSSNDVLETKLIDSLKEQITFLKSNLSQQQKQIEHYLVLEQKILDRFQDLQESLKITQHQLQQQTELAEHRHRLLLEEQNKQKQSFTNNTESFENYDDVEEVKEENNEPLDIYDWLEQNSYNRRKED